MWKKCMSLCLGLLFSLVIICMDTAYANDNEKVIHTQPVSGIVIDACQSATFENLTPDLAEIVSQDGQKAKLNLYGEGDVYVAIHYHNGYETLYHFVVEKVSGDASKQKIEDIARQVLDLVNTEREKAGVRPLKLSAELMQAADVRAAELTQVFSHTRPNGKSCKSVIPNGRYVMGENIAAGSITAEDVVRSWMNSPGHSANILNGDYTELGVGYTYNEHTKYRHYWVQIFRRPMPRGR